MIREQGLIVSSGLGNITHEYSRTWPDLFDHQSIAVTQFQAFLYQQSGLLLPYNFLPLEMILQTLSRLMEPMLPSRSTSSMYFPTI